MDCHGDLTQTQPARSQISTVPQVRHEHGLHARLVSLTDAGFRYEFRRDQKQVEIGRHPDCQIVVKDNRVSGHHCRIYCDENQRYFVEELSQNGLFINEHFMKKGDTRALTHGDTVSLCIYAHDRTQKPFAVYTFLVAGGDSDKLNTIRESSVPDPARDKGQRGALAVATPSGSRHVTDQWVSEHWDIRTILGSGNFSEVRLGVKVEEGSERYAVKVIDKRKFIQFQNKRESHLSLSSEAEVLTKLQHPGIVRFSDWFETDVSLYLVMEYLSGGDLLQCILEDGLFQEPQARRLFQKLCEAVNYLHDKNIIHRDLKPENILLTTKDRQQMFLKIADFGLARTNMKSKDCRTFCGTPHYFAPEVISTFRDQQTGQPTGYGKQADMWSLGVILYIMLSGIPPFEEEGLYEQILEGRYEFDVSEWTSVSLEAKQLVRSLMTVNPKDRLSIKQALGHAWFVGSTSLRRDSSSISGVLSSDEPDAKRRRPDNEEKTRAPYQGGGPDGSLFDCDGVHEEDPAKKDVRIH